jgi:glucose/arabinose dehydrogenase
MITGITHKENACSDWVGHNAQAAVILPAEEDIVVRRVWKRGHRPEEGICADPVRVSSGLLV